MSRTESRSLTATDRFQQNGYKVPDPGLANDSNHFEMASNAGEDTGRHAFIVPLDCEGSVACLTGNHSL